MPRPLLFPGGFLITAAGDALAFPDAELAALVGAWRATRVGRYLVRYDATWRASHAAGDGAEVLLLGTAMDLDAPDAGAQEIADGLAAAAGAGDAAFFERLDALVGAHLVVVRRGDTHHVVQDATGMVALVYDLGGPLLAASHPALIADLRGYEISDLGRYWVSRDPTPEAQRYKLWNGPWHLPGVSTAFERVRALTPNTWLDLETRTVERFWPREPLGILAMDGVVEQVAGHLAAAAAWVAREFPGQITASLSGGMDSRLALAATREVSSQLRYHTYHQGQHPVYRNDLWVAQTLAERLGLEHRAWRLTNYAPTGARAEGWDRTHRGVHGNGALAFRYLDEDPASQVHLRSNVLETVRGFYTKNPAIRPNVFDALKLSRLFRSSTAEVFAPQLEEFVAVTGFEREAMADLHYSDLFYWEHRLGRWHADVVRSQKVAHDTFVLWNSRRILSLLLARPLEDRFKGKAIHLLIDRLWPEVLDVPIFSGARFTFPADDLDVGPPAFAWERIAPEARRALARALDPGVDDDAEAATHLLAARAPEPTAELFALPGVVEAALAEWLPCDPVAADRVYAARVTEPPERRPATVAGRVRRIDALRGRPAGPPLRTALAAALRAAGGRPPAFADRPSLRPYLEHPTSGLLARELAPHQQAVLAALPASGGVGTSGVVEMPAGSGLVRMVARWALEEVVAQGGAVLWVAEERALIEQAALALMGSAGVLHGRRPAIRLRLAGGGYGPERGGLDSGRADVTLALPAALAGDPAGLDALAARGDVVVLVDQAQRTSIGGLPEALRARVGLVPTLPGTSAADRDAARAAFDAPLATAELGELVAAGVLAAVRVHRVETGVEGDAGLGPEALSERDERGMAPRVAARLAGDEARDGRIVDAWASVRRDGRRGSTLAIAVDDRHARALADRFTAAGFEGTWISTAQPDRLRTLDKFRNGGFDVLVTADPVPEGVELPGAGTVLLCRPVASEGALAALCAPAFRGPAVDGTEVADVVVFEDRWEQESGWVDAARSLTPAGT